MQDVSYRYGSSAESVSDRELVAVNVVVHHDLEAMENRLMEAVVKL